MTIEELVEKVRLPLIAGTAGLMLALGYNFATVGRSSHMQMNVPAHEQPAKPAHAPKAPYTPPPKPTVNPAPHATPASTSAPTPIPTPTPEPPASAPETPSTGTTAYYGGALNSEAEAMALTQHLIDSLYHRIDSIQLAATHRTRVDLPSVSIGKARKRIELGGYSPSRGTIYIFVGLDGNDQQWYEDRRDMTEKSYRDELAETLAHELGHDLASERADEIKAHAYRFGLLREGRNLLAHQIISEGLAYWYQITTIPNGLQAGQPIDDYVLRTCAEKNPAKSCEQHQAGWSFVIPIVRKGGDAAIDYLLQHPLRAEDLDHLVEKRNEIMAKF